MSPYTSGHALRPTVVVSRLIRWLKKRRSKS